ncbi:MAG TPA: SBBP repeat-containing protein [Bryobacteraceae bacterium]|nr:SBBP repeat-containing protein [Bryobacteraceae bacterium]
MILVSRITAVLASATCIFAAGIPQSLLVPSQQKKLTDSQVRMPLTFEPNRGQAPSDVRWISRTPDRTLLLTASEALLVMNGEKATTVRMKLTGSNADARTEGVDKLKSISNYFLDNDPSQWRTAIPHYARVKYKAVYPGVDLVYYGAHRELEYDFVVAPGADSSQIELAYEGADKLRVEANGDLILEVNGRSIRQLRPKVYQMIGGKKQEIAAGYRIRNGKRVEFALAKYDRKRELIIDPVLQYSTYFGQEGQDQSLSVATNATGDIYITGQTASTRFQTSGKAQPEPGGNSDAFIAKFTGGGDMLWTSYLGGRQVDVGRSIAVDESGNAYVVGTTNSPEFPMRNAAYETFAGTFDAFLTKISSDGQQFLYSTFLGGSQYDDALDVAVNAQGDAYVAGQTLSFDLPVRNAFATAPAGGGQDTFVVKLATTRTNVFYFTYVGGNGVDLATGLAIDAQGNAYVCGGTTSTVFPLQSPLQPAARGAQEAFLYKLGPNGNTLLYSTFLGGALDDLAFRVAVDATGAAYLLGHTRSTDFPVRGAFQTTLGGGSDVFVSKISPAGDALVYSTFVGGSLDDLGFADIVVDAAGSAYVAGYTSSTNFPTRAPIQASLNGGRNDAFVARVSPQGNSLLYSTYIGGREQDEILGLALDRTGQVVIAGRTSSPDFPQATNQFIGNTLGQFDIFLARLSADTAINFISATPMALTFNARAGVDTPTQTVALASAGAPVTFSVGSNQPWLRVSPESGTTPATLTFSIVPGSLPPANAVATVVVNAPAASNAINIAVTLNVTVAAAITGVTPNPLPRSDQNTDIVIQGTGFQNPPTVRVNGTAVTSLFVSATSVRATIPASVMTAAQPLQIVVANPDGTQSPAFSLPFASAGGPVVSASGIVNGASGLAGPVAPGEIITIYGTGFGPAAPVRGTFVNGILESTVGETRVLVDGVAAPIISAASNQVSAIVPYSVLGRESVGVEVEYRGQRAPAVRLNTTSASPGLFTLNNSGTGQAAATNQDGSFNSAETPAAGGSVITLFGTGEGLALPAGADGRQITGEPPRPVAQVLVLIGGMPAQVEYAGGSPGSVAGLLQINVRLPAGLSAGAAIPVQVSIGGVTSRDGVTIAIR